MLSIMVLKFQDVSAMVPRQLEDLGILFPGGVKYDMVPTFISPDR